VRRLGGCSRKPGSGQTVDSVNIPARELGTRLCTRATASSHEGTTRPAEASRNALRPRRSQTTPPTPRGLHQAGALARTHRNETQPRKAGPLAKKCDKSLQASIKTAARCWMDTDSVDVPLSPHRADTNFLFLEMTFLVHGVRVEKRGALR
jgi:hypothetical protein